MDRIDKDKKYRVTENVVAREIDGEIIIVPLTSGIGDAEDDLFSLNETGKAVWQYLDGEKSVGEIIALLCEKFEGSEDQIGSDVTGFMEELLSRNMLETD